MTDARYVDGTYLSTNPTWHEEDASWKAAQVVRMVNAHGLRPTSVCDIGCGTGGVMANLRRLMPGVDRWIGVDPSIGAISMGRERHPDIAFHVGDAEAGPVTAELVLMLDVFEHVPDYLGFLRLSREVSGKFIFHIPLDLSAYLCARGLHGRLRSGIGHLHYFDIDTALATLDDCGYTVEDHFYTAPGIEVVNSWRGRLAALPRRVAFRAAPDLAARVLGGYALMVLASG